MTLRDNVYQKNYNLKHRDSLLESFSRELKILADNCVSRRARFDLLFVEVELFDRNGVSLITTGALGLLDWIAFDLSWSDEGDWSEAYYVEARFM